MTFQRLLFTSVLFCAACSDPNDGGSDSDAGTRNSGGASSGGAGGSAAQSTETGGAPATGGAVQRCNELELGDAPVAEVTPEPGPPPLAEGGKIADGTYFHTAEIAYRAPPGLNGPFGRARIEIAGSVWQEVSGFPPPDTVNPDKRSTGILSVSGTKLTIQRTCPSAGSPETGEFTAAADHFTLFVVDHGTTFAAVFTKQ